MRQLVTRIAVSQTCFYYVRRCAVCAQFVVTVISCYDVTRTIFIIFITKFTMHHSFSLLLKTYLFFINASNCSIICQD